ncbi:hypothetical protein IHQ71_21325 [Rhizobium sp. TH2]|uniref:M10 family metallopeptidase C-terminal domain-containing protein n=1 Tax=Rhizobium sp. TH2 TaxID=2775403 RepID=UPI00220683CA|nr:hypothetical protein IHQ71_21325 [Rhizobium sp. TH2]
MSSNNIIIGFGGDDFIFGAAGNDKINAGAGEDEVNGGKRNDDITGGAGVNHLTGGKGNDILIGGEGRDVITGCDGEDIFRYLPGQLKQSGSQNNEVVTDFQQIAGVGGDKIQIPAGTSVTFNEAIKLSGGTVDGWFFQYSGGGIFGWMVLAGFRRRATGSLVSPPPLLRSH